MKLPAESVTWPPNLCGIIVWKNLNQCALVVFDLCTSLFVWQESLLCFTVTAITPSCGQIESQNLLYGFVFILCLYTYTFWYILYIHIHYRNIYWFFNKRPTKRLPFLLVICFTALQNNWEFYDPLIELY